MTLVVTLLKLILISKNSRTHLEARIADLIRHYEVMAEEDCHWVVNFLEIFNVTFTIYAENVQYNLIRMPHRDGAVTTDLDIEASPTFTGNANGAVDLDAYRIFSQLKAAPKLSEESEIVREGSEIELLDSLVEASGQAASSEQTASQSSSQPVYQAPEELDPEAFPLLSDSPHPVSLH